MTIQHQNKLKRQKNESPEHKKSLSWVFVCCVSDKAGQNPASLHSKSFLTTLIWLMVIGVMCLCYIMCSLISHNISFPCVIFDCHHSTVLHVLPFTVANTKINKKSITFFLYYLRNCQVTLTLSMFKTLTMVHDKKCKDCTKVDAKIKVMEKLKWKRSVYIVYLHCHQDPSALAQLVKTV